MRGRLLSQYGSVSFQYDGEGFRRKKAYGTDTVTYYYQDGSLLSEKHTDATKNLYFLHNGNEIVGFVDYHSTIFYYRKDVFGNVVAVYDLYGEEVASYTYDAWGNCTIGTNVDGLADLNPIRYRGYYYDKETQLYYLQTRYYDPATGRFISPDTVEYLDPETIHGLNLYAYGLNNPIMYVDPTGHLAFFVLTAIIGAIIGVGITAAVDYIPDKEFDLHWGWYVGAGVLGAAIGAGIGMAISYSATGTLTASFTDIKFGFALKAAQQGNYTKLAKFATHNNGSKQVGLGKYIKNSPNSYEMLSKKYGYTYYEVKPKYWDKMYEVLKDDVWNVNQAFLDQQLSLGKTFVKLSTDYSGFYLQELKYLGLL